MPLAPSNGLAYLLAQSRGYVVTHVLNAVVTSGLAGALTHEGATSESVAERLGFDPSITRAVLEFLVTEGLAVQESGHYWTTELLADIRSHEGWLTLFCGGYGDVFAHIPDALRTGPIPQRRNIGEVSRASCAISAHDSIPLVLGHVNRFRPHAKLVVDVGCGNAQYLVDLCTALPSIRAIGVEGNTVSTAGAEALVARMGLTDRVSVVCEDAVHFLSSASSKGADVFVFAFLLHELLGTYGEEAVRLLLTTLAKEHPRALVIVVEVDRAAAPAAMATPSGLGYYNGYFLLHELTRQALRPLTFWRTLFSECGFNLLAETIVDHRLDPTELEHALALQGR